MNAPRSFVGGSAISLVERSLPLQVDLRGDPGDARFTGAVRACLGAALPLVANTSAGAGPVTLLWLGPDEWLALGTERSVIGALQRALDDLHCAVTDLSDARAAFRIGGRHARDLLAKGVSLDLHPDAFAAGRCAQTLLAGVTVIVHRHAGGFDLLVARSHSEYLWAWLADAAQEFWAG